MTQGKLIAGMPVQGIPKHPPDRVPLLHAVPALAAVRCSCRKDPLRHLERDW